MQTIERGLKTAPVAIQGDQAGERAPFAPDNRQCSRIPGGGVPSYEQIRISGVPPRSELYAKYIPSGDHVGDVWFPRPEVICRRSLPSGFTVKICPSRPW